jgi:protein-disulfide isomerase
MQADDARRQNQGAHAAISANHDRLIDQADPVAENPNGDVTIVEVFDPLCPYCRGLGTAMAQVNKEDRGARLIYKDLPILGPPSVLGPRAPIAAQRQGAYAKLRDTLMDAPGCRQAVSIILPR